MNKYFAPLLAALFILLPAAVCFAFDIECVDTPIYDVLKIFSKEMGVNILPDPKARDIKVNASIKNVEPEEAFELILRMNGLVSNRETKNTLTVFKAGDESRYLTMNTHLFKLNHGDAEEVAKVLKTVYKKVDFVADRRQNSILAAGYFSDDDIEGMEDKIGGLDAAPPRVTVNFEIFKINNTDAADIIRRAKLSTDASKASGEAVFRNIRERGTSVTKATITSMPGADSSIGRTTNVPYPVYDSHGYQQGVAESRAGDIASVRVVSATAESATLEFAVDTTRFIGSTYPGAPPSSSGEKTVSVVEVKNGERVVVGGLKNGGRKVYSSFDFKPPKVIIRNGRDASSGSAASNDAELEYSSGSAETVDEYCMTVTVKID